MKFIIVVVITLTTTVLSAQPLRKSANTFDANNDFTVQPVKVMIGNAPGERQKRTGSTLTIIGGILFVGGVATLASADELYYNKSTSYVNGQQVTTEEGDPKALAGFVMVAGGAGMAIPGIIFWTKGTRRYKAYMAEHGTLSFNVHGTSGSVAYRF